LTRALAEHKKELGNDIEEKNEEIARLTTQIEALQQKNAAGTDQLQLNKKHEADMKAAKDYQTDLQKVIVDMVYILCVLTKREKPENASDPILRLPIIVEGDAFTVTKTAILKQITVFEESIDRVKKEMNMGEVNGAYSGELEQVILDM
jgi:hypothetical protein